MEQEGIGIVRIPLSVLHKHKKTTGYQEWCSIKRRISTSGIIIWCIEKDLLDITWEPEKDIDTLYMS